MSRHVLWLSAAAVSLVWAAFWVFFILASAWSEPGTVVQKLLVSVLGLAIVAGSATAAWFNARAGGALLLAVGLVLTIANFTFFHNPLPTRMFLLFTMALPPVVAGLLFVMSSRHPHALPG